MKKLYIWVVISFFFTFGICMLLIVPAINSRIAQDNINLERLIRDRSADIAETISIPVNQLYAVESYIQRNQGNTEGIEDFAATIVNHKYIRNLIIAPNCVVTQIYPDTEDNRQVLGLDYYKNTSEGNREAILAAERKELLLAGPFTTVVGDKAISGRLPIVLKNENGEKYFWGIISITLEYPEVLKDAELEELSDQGYTYELWHVNVDTGEREIIDSNGTITEDSNYIDKEIKVLNAEWCLRLSPIPRWFQYHETWTYVFLSLGISSMVGIVVAKNLQLSAVKKKLEKMVYYDELTKILNRKGLFHEINSLIRNKEEMMIYYMDLNRFKEINDKYGHAAGDLVLSEFSRRITLHLNKNQIFGRMAGDEFIIICKSNEFDEAAINTFWEKVYKEFEAPIVTAKGEEINLTFSKGLARYTSEDSVDEIISRADKEMYEEKMRFKQKE